jgi:hypothetical protein
MIRRVPAPLGRVNVADGVRDLFASGVLPAPSMACRCIAREARLELHDVLRETCGAEPKWREQGRHLVAALDAVLCEPDDAPDVEARSVLALIVAGGWRRWPAVTG